MMFHQVPVGQKCHIQLLEGGAWTWVKKSGLYTYRVILLDGTEYDVDRTIHGMIPAKLEEGTPVTHWMGLKDVKRPKKIIGRTTRMFEVAMYEDGTADLCGFTFRDHPTMKIIGDGTLQNPLEIVPK